MPNPQTSQDVRVALLYQGSHLGEHLKDALKELGAHVVYEAPPADIDRDRLESSGARVVIVNLDADSDTYIDQLYDVLDAGDYEVLFNDASVSSNLQGWDHARWARNLASKILRRPDVATPPRPPGAEAVPTPVQKSASGVPVAEKPGPKESGPAAPAMPTPAPESRARPVSADTPTVELPLPDLGAPTAPQPEDLDITTLAEFAQLAEPEPLEEQSTPAAKPATNAASDFAAELDALFASAGLGSSGADELEISLPPETDAAPAAQADAQEFSFDIGAIDLPPDLPTSPPVTGTSEPETAGQPADFPAIFDQLDEIAAAVPAATDGSFKPGQLPAAAPPSEATASPLLPPEWNLDPLGDEIDAPIPAPGERSTFGVEKIAASEYLAPQVEEATATQQPVSPASTGGFNFELMPMEEAVAPVSFEKPAHYQAESWLDGSRPAQRLKVGTGAGVQRVFVLGASIGGPEAVRDFLGALPAGFPMLFLLAQHMGEEFLELMSAQLAKSVALTVRNPTHGEHVGHGEVLIVPTTHRLQVDGEGVITLAHLNEKPPYSPSIDQVLRDVADQFGANAGAIIFSGMAHDAVEGSQYLKSRGGTIWAQDPDTCVISSMVDGAREAGVVSFLGSPAQLAQQMITEYGKG